MDKMYYVLVYTDEIFLRFDCGFRYFSMLQTLIPQQENSSQMSKTTTGNKTRMKKIAQM